MVLASLYRDWCALVWDEIQDDSPEVWLGAVHVSAVHIGQLLGPDEDFEEEELGEALNVLMRRERARVVEALLKGFGGVEGLYISLWLSNGDIDLENEEQEHIKRDRRRSDQHVLGVENGCIQLGGRGLSVARSGPGVRRDG